MSPIWYRDKKASVRTSVILAAIYILAVAAFSYIEKTGNLSLSIMERVLYAFPISIAFVACFWASTKTRSYKRLWRLMTTGMLFWMLGEATYLGYMIALKTPTVPSPSIADVFSIAYLPIILGVMMSIVKIKPPFDSNTKQFLTSVAMAGLAIFMLAYKFILLPAWHSAPDLDILSKIYTIAYPLSDWIIFVSLMLALHRFKESRVEGWLVLLIMAFTLAIIGDVAFFVTGSLTNPISILAMSSAAVLIALSAIDEVTGALVGTRRKIHKNTDSGSASPLVALNLTASLFISLITMAVIPATWLGSMYAESYGETPVLVSLSVGVISLSLYRAHMLAADNALLFAKALQDSLTGLKNHRYFQETLEKAVAKSNKSGKPVSMIIADIDNFSHVNTRYGHALGDRVLAIIGNTVLTAIGEADEACRLGGDEFAVILPSMGGAETAIFAEQLKNDISIALRDTFPERPPTLTIGISTYPTLAKNRAEFVNTADGALYWGKSHGKNSIVIYDANVVEVMSAEERARKAEESSFLDIVKSLAEAVDARDPYTWYHSQGVGAIAGRLAAAIGLDKSSVDQIEAAGLLHDVGKIGMPDDILSKPQRLTDEEMAIIKTHPVLSAQIIQSTSLKDMVIAVRAHHERWDGRGYPDGLKGEEIPLAARILAIADTFDAMTTDRPYRSARSREEALLEIERCSGTQFDPQLAAAFLKIMSSNTVRIRHDDDLEGEGAPQLNRASGQ